ncbi:MAG: hypothetical protein RLZZ618_4191 [Pseudomonadota bacterium]|jgi:hypothetical protein
MSWFIAPLRPLSHTGQVLLCTAAALLAAALMVAWTPSSAESSSGLQSPSLSRGEGAPAP